MGRFTEFIIIQPIDITTRSKSKKLAHDGSSIGGRFSCVVCKCFLPVRKGIYGRTDEELSLEWYCNECSLDLNVQEYVVYSKKGSRP